jgi:hypothetical protein
MPVSDPLAISPSLARFSVDRAESEPPFRQIARAIHDAVVCGELPQGERLPPERALASAFHVGRSTIARALTTLADTGLIERRVGRGTFVAFDVQSWQAGPTAAIPWGALLNTVPVQIAPPPPPRSGRSLQLRNDAASHASAADRDGDSIILTSSGAEAVRFLVEALIRERDRVIVETPAPTSLTTSISMRGATVIELPRDNHPQSAVLESLLESELGAKLVFLRPRNPDSGHDQPRADLAHTLGLTKRFGLPVIELSPGRSISLELEPHDHVVQIHQPPSGQSWISAPNPLASQLLRLASLLGIGAASARGA